MVVSRRRWRRVLCLGLSTTEEDRSAVDRVRSQLDASGFEVVDAPESKSGASSNGVDLIVVLGGDGFLMETLEQLDYPATPIFGVNFGTVGFHMNPHACADRLCAVLLQEQLESGAFSLLSVEATLESGETTRRRAFNDVILERDTRQSVRFRVSIDGEFYNHFAGDGFVVATPAGTTAYNLAAGGPAVHPGIEAMTITPLYPHRVLPFTSVQFSVVVPLSSVIDFSAEELPKRGVRLVTDGDPLRGVERVRVQDSGQKITLLRVRERGFFRTLGQKIIGG